MLQDYLAQGRDYCRASLARGYASSAIRVIVVEELSQQGGTFQGMGLCSSRLCPKMSVSAIGQPGSIIEISGLMDAVHERGLDMSWPCSFAFLTQMGEDFGASKRMEVAGIHALVANCVYLSRRVKQNVKFAVLIPLQSLCVPLSSVSVAHFQFVPQRQNGCVQAGELG